MKRKCKGKVLALGAILAGSLLNVEAHAATTSFANSNDVVVNKAYSGKGVVSVKGVVRDQSGEPIIGGSILVKGTKTGITTDVDGNYTLKNIPADATLVFSYVGYATKEMKANEAVALANVVLTQEASMLDDIVVVGYASQQKSKTTGSIAHLKSSDISDMPVTSFDQAIAGKLPGVQVMQQSGAPGKSASIKIRGASSITAGTEPLYVIDGFPTSSADMSNLNPEDIATVDVLKDASSAAIYGSRGANGVIIITTKKGKEGAPKVTGRAYYGVQEVAKKVDLMDAYEFANFVATARNNYHLSLKQTNQITDDNSKRDKKARIPDYLQPYLNGETGLTNTDWQDAIFRTAPIQQYTIGVSGASDRVSYYTSVA